MPLPVFSAPQTKADASFHWFVYGSSLDFDALRAWCGQHGYVVPDLSKAIAAKLAGWRIAFNVNSNFWGGAVASLVEDEKSSVEGVAIPLAAESLGFVRHKEGVVSGLFEEKAASCSAGDSTLSCKVYVASSSRTIGETAPAPRLLETLIKGAKERGLSSEWIASLEKRR